MEFNYNVSFNPPTFAPTLAGYNTNSADIDEHSLSQHITIANVEKKEFRFVFIHNISSTAAEYYARLYRKFPIGFQKV